MLAVVFNSLLILLPVIGANTVRKAYQGAGVAESTSIDAIRQTSGRLDREFRELAPKEENRKLAFWQGKVQGALEAKDTDALRGYLLAAPAMLGNELGKQVRARAEAETRGSADERTIRAALQRLPEPIARSIEQELGLPQSRENMKAPDASADPDAPDMPDPDRGEVLEAGGRAQPDWRFQLLGSYSDLATLSERWINGDLADGIVFRLTGIVRVQKGLGDGLSDANIRAVSIVKSASRSRRLTPAFTDYLDSLTSDAVPYDALAPALADALDGPNTSEVRGLRVQRAFEQSIDPAGLARLEGELEHIDRLASLTSPTAALTLLSAVEDATDLRRARMLAEAGGMQAVALVEERGNEGLRVADAGVSWNASMVLEVMSLTAAGMLLFWIALSTVTIYLPIRPGKAEPQGI